MYSIENRVLWFVGVVLFVLFVLSGIGEAQPLPCAGQADVLATLDKTYGEKLLWSGRAGAQLLVITANPDGSSWTAILIEPNGRACPFGAGQGWTAGNAAPNGTEG